ncbi:MAG: MCP four helix bundle domain-containing protein [Acidobacteria bacterium]|nr:MCP four helix bundle domain-containing protein [Acidobacteriota bacterium]
MTSPAVPQDATSQDEPSSPGRQLHRATAGLLVGLFITLAAVVGYSLYVTRQIAGLRELQSSISERNRKDSLQLLRIQNNLNEIAIGMRDMLDNVEPYPLTAFEPQFQRMRADLDDAIAREQELAMAARTPEQRQYLQNSVSQFWNALDRIFELARAGREDEARVQIRLSLQSRQAALSTAVARLLVENNESEQQAAAQVRAIYDRVQRQAYIFLFATLAAIVLTSVLLIRSNRELFRRLATLSEQRSDLAQKLISTQESTLSYVSRELHDEFGQILTAIGAMLTRAARRTQDAELNEGLKEIRDVAQSALDKVRTLSQALHPVMLDESGLEQSLDWYIPTVERQTGITISYEKSGTRFEVSRSAGVHVYRVVQEALNNVKRHSGAQRAWVRLRFGEDTLEVEIEDRGRGLGGGNGARGIGLVGMRERARLIGAELTFTRPTEGGTLVRLRVPRRTKSESSALVDG